MGSYRSELNALEMAMPESRCTKCRKRIRKGHPRFVVEFKEFGIGPWHPAFSKEAWEQDRFQNESSDGGDREFGLLHSTAFALCGPCGGEDPTIANPWHAEREARAADDPGGSVWTTPISQIRVDSGGVGEDYKFAVDMGKKDDKPISSCSRTESEDRYLSGHLTHREVRSRPGGRSPFTEDDRRHRMARFLLTAESGKMEAEVRKDCELWSAGMKQSEVAKQTGKSQPTVSRSIEIGDEMAVLYSRRAQKK